MSGRVFAHVDAPYVPAVGSTLGEVDAFSVERHRLESEAEFGFAALGHYQLFAGNDAVGAG